MEVTSDFMSFTTRYARTALDLVLFLRPKRFLEAARTHPDRYLEPLQFLFVSLGLSTLVGFTFASMLLEGEELAALERIGMVGTAVIVAGVWLINFFLVFLGKCVAILLRFELTLQQLFEAYCYASVFFPFFVAANMAAFWTYTEPRMGSSVVALVIQVIFAGFLITMMARVAQLTRPKFAAFVVVTPLGIFGFSMLLGAVAMSEHGSAPESGRALSEFVGVESEDDTRNSYTCNSAVLYGSVNPRGLTTTAWFQWGTDSTFLTYTTPEQTIAHKSRYRQVLTPLPSATTFYYRAVVWNANGSAVGKIKSFTTPQCTY